MRSHARWFDRLTDIGWCELPSVRVSAGQHQRGIDDQAAALVVEGALQAAGERGVDLGRGERRLPRR